MRFLPFLFLFHFSFGAFAQFSFDNPSFEGEPQDAIVPAGWIGCEPFTTPDILPGYWGVYNEASDGETFVGIITRRDGSFESFGQRTKQVLKKGECYAFAVDVAHSKTYAGYNGVIKLKVWIGGSKCEKDQLVYETNPLKSTDWKNIVIEFTPKQDTRYIIFEAAYDTSKAKPYNGNLLLDNVSMVVPCKRA